MELIRINFQIRFTFKIASRTNLKLSKKIWEKNIIEESCHRSILYDSMKLNSMTESVVDPGSVEVSVMYLSYSYPLDVGMSCRLVLLPIGAVSLYFFDKNVNTLKSWILAPSRNSSSPYNLENNEWKNFFLEVGLKFKVLRFQNYFKLKDYILLNSFIFYV